MEGTPEKLQLISLSSSSAARMRTQWAEFQLIWQRGTSVSSLIYVESSMGWRRYCLDCFKDPKSRIYRQMERVILKVHWECQSYMYDQNVDLGDFCELLDKECETVANELGGGDDIIC
jgi:hypothetical protein